MSTAEPYNVERTAPALSRQHEAGTLSAKGLLFTILGEVVLPVGKTAWTGSLIEVLGQLGVEEKAARQALMRTASDGWLTAERIGRRTKWHLTPAAQEMLTEGARRIYSFTGPAGDWDGRWVLVSTHLPESDRRTRHILRSRLAWAGFGSLAPGLWISSHVDREAEAIQVLTKAGCADTSSVFVATRPGVGPVKSMVAKAWDLDAIEAKYEEFLAEFGTVRPGHLLRDQLELVHAWRRFPAIDPSLPRELLPPKWNGVKAAQLFSRRHKQASAGALARWCEIEAEQGGS